MHLKHQGLTLSSLRVHFAAISAFHPLIQNRSVFARHITVRFPKDLERLYPQVRDPTPPWNLNLVLARLTGPPFELLVPCSFMLFMWKVSFVVAITSAWRLSEIRS